ncbi:MAG: hypothetical protein Q9211_006106 [Gyalolechia sp. 1 TL-2023]
MKPGQTPLLPRAYHGNASVVTPNLSVRRLQREELAFLVFLRKLNHQFLHQCTLAIQRSRRMCQRNLVATQRQASILPTELYLPSDGEIEMCYYFLSESANFVDIYGLQSGPERIEAAALFRYWDRMWRSDRTPGKVGFWGNWRGARDTYYNLVGIRLYEQGMADRIREQPTPTLGPIPSERAPRPVLPDFHLNPYVTDNRTTAHHCLIDGPPIMPCQVSPVNALDWLFFPQEMEFIAAVRLQWVLDYHYLAEVITRVRRHSPCTPCSDPRRLPEAAKATKVQEAFESLLPDCPLVLKWRLPIPPGDRCWPQYCTYWNLVRWGIDMCRREMSLDEGRCVEIG